MLAAGKNITLANSAGAHSLNVAGTVTTGSTSGLIVRGRSTLNLESGADWTQNGPLTIQPQNTSYGATMNVKSGSSFTYNGSAAIILGADNPSNDLSTVTIGDSGVLQLTYEGTDTVDKLFIGTTQQAAGVYGKEGSALPIIGIPQITGDGTLTVASDPSGTSFQTFMAGYPGLTGDDALPEADPDGDGLSNLAEFIMGGTAPDSGSAAIRPAEAVISGHLTFSMLVPSGATFAGSPSPSTTMQNVQVAVGGSLDLATFARPVEKTVLNPGLPSSPSGYEWHTFRLSEPISSQSRGFLRASFSSL